MNLHLTSSRWLVVMSIVMVLRGCQVPLFVTGVSESQKIRLFDGESLEGWEITPWMYRGEVEVKNRTILFGIGHECTGITWKEKFPRTNYEVSLDAMRIEGSDFFCGMTFPVGEQPCTLIIGGWGGQLVGLSSINGLDASENSTGVLREFDNNRWHHIRLRVTQDSISVWIDEEQVVEHPVHGYHFSVRMEVRWSRPFGICSYRTRAAIRNFTLQTPVI